VIGTIKTRRERLSRCFGKEIDGHEDRIFVMVVSVPYGLVLIGIKPGTYFDHRCEKFSIAYPDRDTVHSPLHVFVDATMAPRQISGQELLTKIIGDASFNPILGMRIKGSLDLKGGIGCGAKGPSRRLREMGAPEASIVTRCRSPGRVISAAAPRAIEIILGTTRSAPRASRSFTAPPTQPFGETGPAGTQKSCSWHRCRLWYLHLAAEAGIIVTADRAEAVLEVGRDGAGRFKSVVLRPTVTWQRAAMWAGRSLHQPAHEKCFIANSVNFPVECEPEIVPAAEWWAPRR
jgi:hypothetical protein